MGRLGDEVNRFWQLLVVPPGASRWSLVTPPGVADNGGLVSADSTGTIVTGFEPSQGLYFSPLATTTDDGRSWTAAGVLGVALAPVPDALATTSTSSGAQVLALTGGRHPAVLASQGRLSSWRTLVTEEALARSSAGQRCGLSGLSGVATMAGGATVVGGTCSRPGTVGIFVRQGHAWRIAGVTMPAGLSGATTKVIRLLAAAGSLDALVVARQGSEQSLFEATLLPGGMARRPSATLPLGRSLEVTSSGSAPDGAVFVVQATATGPRVEQLSADQLSWTAVTGLPPDTATVAFTPAGQLDAFVVHLSTLTVLDQPAPGGGWVHSQVITAPILYGSSS